VRRGCSCDLCSELCPIHALGPWLEKCSVGDFPFGVLSPATATRKLRGDLLSLSVADHMSYTLHSFRRGGAQDMKELGCSVEDLQRAGGWNSRACFLYVMPDDLDMLSAVTFMVDESDSD
jgi:hypothetical protein